MAAAAAVTTNPVLTQPAQHPTQPHFDVKLFNRWTYEDVQVSDISLNDYIGVQAAKNATYVPHTAGRYAVKRFRKARCPIVERLTNSLMMHKKQWEKDDGCQDCQTCYGNYSSSH